MSAPRLTTALADGAVTLPVTGRIAVFRPRAGMDLSALPADRVHVIQGFRPDHDAFAAAGLAAGVAPEGRYAAAIVCLTRSKAESRALLAEAMARTDGPVIVDGQKTDGIESILRDIRRRGAVGEVVSRGHGKLFAVTGGDFADWAAEAAPRRIADGYLTRPGIFSADAPDPGSVALAAALPARLPGRIADLGAGWGWLARAVLDREGVEEVHLIEAEHAALDCARANVTDPRAHFHWADATAFRPAEPFDAVVSNPPFHTGRAAEPDIGRRFIAAAAAMLKPAGTLWLVANRHLPYEAEARARFAAVEEIAGDPRYKILAAKKPRRGSR